MRVDAHFRISVLPQEIEKDTERRTSELQDQITAVEAEIQKHAQEGQAKITKLDEDLAAFAQKTTTIPLDVASGHLSSQNANLQWKQLELQKGKSIFDRDRVKEDYTALISQKTQEKNQLLALKAELPRLEPLTTFTLDGQPGSTQFLLGREKGLPSSGITHLTRQYGVHFNIHVAGGRTLLQVKLNHSAYAGYVRVYEWDMYRRLLNQPPIELHNVWTQLPYGGILAFLSQDRAYNAREVAMERWTLEGADQPLDDSDEEGPDEEGPDEEGPDEEGPDEEGPDEEESDEEGPDDSKEPAASHEEDDVEESDDSNKSDSPLKSKKANVKVVK